MEETEADERRGGGRKTERNHVAWTNRKWQGISQQGLEACSGLSAHLGIQCINIITELCGFCVGFLGLELLQQIVAHCIN